MAGEWEYKSIEECVEEIIDYRGKTPKKSENGIPLITAKIIKNGRIDTPKEFIPVDQYESWMRRGIPKSGDVLITTEAPLGEIAQLDNANIALAQRVIVLRGKSNLLDNTYLRYVLKSPSVMDEILSRATGTTVLGIKQSELKKVKIPLPSLSEQKLIGKMLFDLDERVDLNLKINNTLEEIARAIFKRWFIDFEFPNENGEPYKSSGGEMIDSPLGPIPKGWEVSYIGDLLQIKRKSVSPEEVPTEFPYIGLEHMPKGSICLDIWGQVGTVKSEKMRFNKGDILFGKLRPYFHKVGIAPVDGVCSTDILVLNVEDSNYWSLAVESVARKEFIDYASAVSTGTRMPRANWEDLKRFKVSIPCGSHSLVLERFDNIFRNYVSAFFEGIYESKVLSMMRDSLLPKLMSGEIRVPVSEEEAD